MDSILFIVSLLCLVLVAGWYVGNEATKASGTWGLLAIAAPKGREAEPAGPRYQAQDRIAPGRTESTVLEKAAPGVQRPVRFAEKGAGRFLSKDDSGYRTRGRLPMADDPRRDDDAKD